MKQKTLQKVMRQNFISLDSKNQFSGRSNLENLETEVGNFLVWPIASDSLISADHICYKT
jgi:hypothetical protein